MADDIESISLMSVKIESTVKTALTEDSNNFARPNGVEHAERILAKLFSDPIPNPIPDGGMRLLPRGTDKLMCQVESTKHQLQAYSPALWADPLLPFNVIVNGVESCGNTLPLVAVERNWAQEYAPRLSEWAERVVRVSDDGEGLGELLVSNVRRTGTSYLLDKFQGKSTPDEGPFIRLGLLMVLLAPDDWFEHGTSVVKNMVMNGYVKKGSIERWWSSPVEDSTDTQIGSKQGSSRLYVRSITEYTRMLEGDSEVSIKCDGQSVCSSTIKFIPVKASWEGTEWLLPFILAHTTTEWWNHALQISLEVAVPNPADEEATMFIKTVPKAATVYYPGRYEHICLVVVDQDQLFSELYSIGGEFEATYGGNPNFSQYVYHALGRLPSYSPGRCISIEDCFVAWNVMAEATSFDLAAKKNPLLLGILATSRFCGFSVWPSPTGKEHHIRGVMSFNSQNPIKIGDSTTRDWSELLEDPEDQQLSQAVEFFTYWRVDPMLLFPGGQVRFRTPQEPLLEEVVTFGYTYSCGEACDEFRILAYAGAFHETRPNGPTYSSPFAFLNSAITCGSLMLGLMTWYTAEKGITLFHHNNDGKTRFSDRSYWISLSKLTNAFFRSTNGSHENILEIVAKHLSLEQNWQRVWTSSVVPWWHARAVAEKFGWNKWTVVRGPAQSQPIATLDEQDSSYGYLLGANSSENTQLSFLAQSIAYEKPAGRGLPAFFKISTPDAALCHLQTNWISWYYNALNDCPYQEEQEDEDYEGIVELNALVLPTGQQYNDDDGDGEEARAFVSHLARYWWRESDLQIVGGLHWPQM